MKMFDAYEIHPCVHVADTDYGVCYEQVSPADPIKADIWSLYGHVPGEGLITIGDFTSYAAANEIYYRITGHEYGLCPDDCSPEMRLSYDRLRRVASHGVSEKIT